MSETRSLHRGRFDDAGDTLVEVLITIIILSVTGLALLEAFSATITGSAQYRSLAGNDVVLRAAAESAYSLIAQQPGPAYSVCATAADYNAVGGNFGAPSNFTATIWTVLYWDSTLGDWTSTVPACTADFTPQQITMKVTNPNGSSETTTFVVNDFGLASPSGSLEITSLSPSSIGQGVTTQMILSGQGFDSNAVVTLSGPNDVSVSTAYKNSTTLVLTMSAVIGAEVGPRTLTVTNPQGAPASIDFTVTTSPTVISVSPSVLAQGGNESITLTGASFESGMSATILTAPVPPSTTGLDAGISVNSVTYVNSTTATLSVSVSPTAAIGYDTISVTIPGGASFTSSSILQITPPPSISSPTSSSPCNPGIADGTVDCTITGSNFEAGAQVSISANGVVNNPAGNPASTTSITVSITGQGTSGGTGNIIVTNPDGTTATIVNGFVNGP